MQRFPFTIAQRILPSCWRRQRISTHFEQLRFSFVIFNSERWLWCSDGVPNCTAIGWNPDGKQAYTLFTDHSIAGKINSRFTCLYIDTSKIYTASCTFTILESHRS